MSGTRKNRGAGAGRRSGRSPEVRRPVTSSGFDRLDADPLTEGSSLNVVDGNLEVDPSSGT